MSERVEAQAKITAEVAKIHEWAGMKARDIVGIWPTKIRTAVFVTEASGETIQFEVETLFPEDARPYLEDGYIAWLKREVIRDAQEGLP